MHVFFVLQVKKIKAIYHIMNMFNLDVTQRCLIAECWCPVEELDEIQRALTRGTVSMDRGREKTKEGGKGMGGGWEQGGGGKGRENYTSRHQ